MNIINIIFNRVNRKTEFSQKSELIPREPLVHRIIVRFIFVFLAGLRGIYILFRNPAFGASLCSITSLSEFI